MSRGRVRAHGAALIGAALLLSGCGHAGAEQRGVFEAPGVFRIGKPGDGWRLVRNLREGSRLLVDYRDADDNADVRVSVQALDDRTRRMPLPILAEAVVASWGRSQGLATDVDAIERADFGAHEGIVVFAHRYWPEGGVVAAKMAEHAAGDDGYDPLTSAGAAPATSSKKVEYPSWAVPPQGIPITTPPPGSTTPRGYLAHVIDPTKPPPAPVVHKVERRMAQAFVRAGDRVVIVTCIAPDAAFERVTPEFEAAMQRFAVEMPADAPMLGLTLPSDLPQAAGTAGAGSTPALPVTTPPAP